MCVIRTRWLWHESERLVKEQALVVAVAVAKAMVVVVVVVAKVKIAGTLALAVEVVVVVVVTIQEATAVLDHLEARHVAAAADVAQGATVAKEAHEVAKAAVTVMMTAVLASGTGLRNPGTFELSGGSLFGTFGTLAKDYRTSRFTAAPEIGRAHV